MPTRPLTEKYKAFASNPQTDKDVWDMLDEGADEPQTPIEQHERTRMQPVKDPDLDRRGALIRAGAGAVAGVLAAKGADKVASFFPNKKEAEAPSENVDSASLEIEIMRRMTKNRKNDHKILMQKYASAKIGRTDNRTRLEYAIEKINASKLPKMVKAILPYLPMQESKYKLSLTSSAGATGPWQFMPGTAELYGLKGNDFDKRRDFKASTDTAIRFFGDIIRKLKKSEHFKTLESQMSAYDTEEFLSLITVNAFNSGINHMLRAMKLLATEKDIKKEVINAIHLGGGEGLYVYLTKVYNCHSKNGIHKGKYGKKYQKGIKKGRFYANESSAYVYNILAFKWIHENTKPKKAPSNIKPIEKAPLKPQKISTITAGVSAAVLAAMGYLGVKRVQEGKEFFGDVMLTRRELMGIGATTVAAGVAGMAENKLGIYDKVSSINLSCDGDKEKKKARKFNTKDISDNAEAIKKACDCGYVTDAELIKPSRYKLAQDLADGCYDEFKRTSNVKFMQIARYYYEYCLYLIEEQLKGKMLLPKDGGREKVLERKKYIKAALKIVNS